MFKNWNRVLSREPRKGRFTKEPTVGHVKHELRLKNIKNGRKVIKCGDQMVPW